MASDQSNDSRLRSIALKQATMIEDKRKLRRRIADMVLECFDLPSESGVTPSKAPARDKALFKDSLNLFQSTDFDDLVVERNIDNRCGYALCSKPNRKATHSGKKVWSVEAGFFVDKSEYERWCSKQCGNRGMFVKAQLGTEPAWLRDSEPLDVRLLDEVSEEDDLSAGLKSLAMSDANKLQQAEKLKKLSEERGDGGKPSAVQLDVRELIKDATVSVPPTLESGNLVEGHAVQDRRRQRGTKP